MTVEMDSPEIQTKRRLRRVIDEDSNSPKPVTKQKPTAALSKQSVIDLDGDEDQMLNWLRDKRAAKNAGKYGKDSDESSDSNAPKRRVKKAKLDSSQSDPPSGTKKPRQKFEAEKGAMLAFLSKQPVPAVKPAAVAAPVPATEKKLITDPSMFFSAKAPTESKPKAVKSFEWDDNAGVKFDETVLSSEATRPVKAKSPVKPVKVSSPPKKASPAASPPKLPAASARAWEGQSVVLTGVLSRLGREEAAQLIETKLGAKITSAVSGKTAYLVTGPSLEDGRPMEEGSKYRKVQEMITQGKEGPQIITEESLLALLGDLPIAAKPVPVLQALNPKPSSTSAPRSQPWVEKYRPQSQAELVGNTGMVQKLSGWLADWHKVNFEGEKKPASFRPGEGSANSKAALISGPPGIGKTSAVLIICRQQGYEPIEFNASDSRTKNAVEEVAACLSGSKVLSGTGRACIIMDEVDGMSGGDRGGNAALIALIKKTRVPVICLCNDRMSNKVRSLANSCYDLRFQRPSRQEVAARAMAVLKAEGCVGKWDDAQLNQLAESSGCDIRQVLNHLEFCSKSALTSSPGAKDEQGMVGAFDVCKTLLTSTSAGKLSFSQRLDLSFVDYDLIPLLIQQNYPRCVEKVTDPRALAGVARAAEYIAQGDVVSNTMRQSQNWSLLSEYCALSCVAPSFACNNFLGFPEFPAWLGKNSTRQKNVRLLRELRLLLLGGTSAGASELIRSGYSDVLYSRLVTPLSTGDIATTVGLLNDLEIPKDVLTEHLSELRVLPNQPDKYKEVDPKTKAAFTRAYNASAGKVRVVLVAPQATKQSSGALMGDEEEEEETETKETESGDKLVKGLVKESKPKASAKKKK